MRKNNLSHNRLSFYRLWPNVFLRDSFPTCFLSLLLFFPLQLNIPPQSSTPASIWLKLKLNHEGTLNECQLRYFWDLQHVVTWINICIFQLPFAFPRGGQMQGHKQLCKHAPQKTVTLPRLSPPSLGFSRWGKPGFTVGRWFLAKSGCLKVKCIKVKAACLLHWQPLFPNFFFFFSFQLIQVLLSYKLPLTQQLKTTCSVLLGGYRPAGQSCWSGLVAGLGWSIASVILLSAWLWAGRESSSGMASITSWRWRSPLATGPHGPSFPSRPVVHMFQENNWNQTGLGWELAKCPFYHILLTKVTKLFQFQAVGEKASFWMAENAVTSPGAEG